MNKRQVTYLCLFLCEDQYEFFLWNVKTFLDTKITGLHYVPTSTTGCECLCVRTCVSAFEILMADSDEFSGWWLIFILLFIYRSHLCLSLCVFLCVTLFLFPPPPQIAERKLFLAVFLCPVIPFQLLDQRTTSAESLPLRYGSVVLQINVVLFSLSCFYKVNCPHRRMTDSFWDEEKLHTLSDWSMTNNNNNNNQQNLKLELE